MTGRGWYKKGKEVGVARHGPFTFASTGSVGYSFAFAVHDPSYPENASAILGVVGLNKAADEPCYDFERRNSYAMPAAHAVERWGTEVKADGDLGTTIAERYGYGTTERDDEDRQAISANLYEKLVAEDRGYEVMMFVGMKSGNFYGIIDCRSNVQHAGSKCRAAGADARYVYIERNFELHGDKRRHSFVYGADNKVGIDAVEVHVTDDDYNTTARSWYTLGARQTLGWTAPYSFASVSVTGTTYATSIRNASGDVLGVVGADHVGDEPRYDSCMRNSYAEGASFGLATALSVDGAALAKDVASIAGKSEGDNAKLESIASALYAQWKANDNGEGIGVYFGSESNDNFYGLYDCNNRMNVRSEACRHAAVRDRRV